MKIYRLKHIPTGLYYTPSTYKNASNLSVKGKIYGTNSNALNGSSPIIGLYLSPRIYQKYKEIFDKLGVTSYYGKLFLKCPKSDFKREEINQEQPNKELTSTQVCLKHAKDEMMKEIGIPASHYIQETSTASPSIPHNLESAEFIYTATKLIMAAHLEEAMKVQHLSKEQFASMLGKSVESVEEILSGDANLTLKDLSNICAVLHIEIISLFQTILKDTNNFIK